MLQYTEICGRRTNIWIIGWTQCGIQSSLSASTQKGKGVFLNWKFFNYSCRWVKEVVMLDSLAAEGSALAVTKKPSSNSFVGSKQTQYNKELYQLPINKDDLWHNYCKKPRHTKEMYLKLKWKTWFGKNNKLKQFIPRKSQSNVVVTNANF